VTKNTLLKLLPPKNTNQSGTRIEGGTNIVILISSCLLANYTSDVKRNFLFKLSFKSKYTYTYFFYVKSNSTRKTMRLVG
jgi:hypothetical protein